jgi:hypothetical protein
VGDGIFGALVQLAIAEFRRSAGMAHRTNWNAGTVEYQAESRGGEAYSGLMNLGIEQKIRRKIVASGGVGQGGNLKLPNFLMAGFGVYQTRFR